MVWSQSSGALRGHEGQPLVVEVDGKPMMYMVSAWPNIVQALDLTDPDNPKEIWNYLKKTDRDESAVPRACCDTVNRGLSYAEGKVVFGTLTVTSSRSMRRPASKSGSSSTATRNTARRRRTRR